LTIKGLGCTRASRLSTLGFGLWARDGSLLEFEEPLEEIA
jgi:hypothetical protein